MSAVGHLQASELVQVERGIYLARRQARAYRRVKVAFRQAGKDLEIIHPYGGYRSAAVQNGMSHAAGPHGTREERARYDMDPSLRVNVPPSPWGPHETGMAMDVLVNGTSPGSASLALLGRYGWTRTFGLADRNHMHHNNRTAVVPVSRAWLKRNGLFIP